MKNLPSLDLLKNPSKTSAIIFLVDVPTKSVLLFDDKSRGLTGYLFTDPTSDKAVKEKSINDLTLNTNITVLETNPLCSDVIEINLDDENSEWRFIIIIKEFKIPNSAKSNGLPTESKWYNKNQITSGKIRCRDERVFLIDFMKRL